MQITTRAHSGCLVLRVQGELAPETAPRLKQAIAAALEEGCSRILLHLELSFIDSAGLAALISGLRRVREAGGWLGIATSSAAVRRILDLTGVDSLIPVFQSPEEALEGLQP
jgi:anti-sigma B factor antagonist